MIKLIKKTLFVLTLLTSFNALAQSPGISYQAVIVNTGGSGTQGLPGENLDDELFRNKQVTLRFKIYNSTLQDEYVEEHSVTTDEYGMINVVIGWGNPTFQSFKDVEWDGKDKWLDVFISFAPPSFNTLELKKPLFSLPTPGVITREEFNGLSDSLLAHILEDQDTDTSNEIQNITLEENNLNLSNGGGVVDLSPFANTDNQNLNINGTTLSIDDGNSVDLSSIQDGIGTDDQNLTYYGNGILGIDDGNVINLNDLQDGTGTDDQALSLDNNILTLEDGGNVSLATYLDNTDSQELSIDGDSLRLINGGAVALDLLGSDDQTLAFDTVTSVLTIEDGNNVDLSSLIAAGSSDDQTLSISNDSLRLEDGGAVALQNLGSDDQVLSISGDSLYLQNGGNVDLGYFLDNTDSQQLNIDGDSLRLEDGGAVALQNLGSDDQVLSISNDTIFLENGGFVKLPAGTVDTDDQFLSFSGDTLYLDNGGFVDLSSLSGSGGAGTDDQTLAFDTVTSVLSIEDGNSIDLSELNNLTINGAITYGGVTSFNTLTYTVQDSDNLIIQAGAHPLGTQILITLPDPALNLGRVLTFSNAGANGGEIIQFVDPDGNNGIVIGATQSINAIITVQLVCVGTAWMFSTGY